MPLGNWNGHNNSSSFCVPSLASERASEPQSILLAGAFCPLRKMLAPSTPLLWGSPPRFKAWDDTKEQKNYYYYYYLRWYKRTGWEAGGGTNTKTLSSAHLLANCTKKTTISHTDRPHKSDIVQLDLHNRACHCQCSKIQQRKKEAGHQKLNWESLKRKSVFLFMGLKIWNFLWCIYSPFGSYGPKDIAKFNKKVFFGTP